LKQCITETCQSNILTASPPRVSLILGQDFEDGAWCSIIITQHFNLMTVQVGVCIKE